MNYKMIRYIIGVILAAESAFMILPMLVSAGYNEQEIINSFAQSILITFAAAVLFGIKKPKNDLIFAKESYIAVALGWVLASIFGAMPFYLSGAIPSFLNAFFETVSGLTTTGATILDTVETMPKGLLFWRAFTQWIGGMGIIMFLMMLTQFSEGHSLYIMRAEVPGPSVGKITPKASSNAFIVYGIYTGLTALEVLFLMFGDMPVFDAVTMSMATAGTGGFMVRDAGMTFYNSAYVEWIVGIFMLVFSINLNLYYLLLLRRFGIVFRSEETRALLGIVAFSTVVMAFSTFSYYGDMPTALRKAFFLASGTISTSAFNGEPYMQWPYLCHAVILLLMFIGGCAGSSAGGLKIGRVVMSVKMLRKEAHRLAHPHEITTIKFEGKFVDKETGRFIMVYMTAFFIILALSSVGVMMLGHDYETAFSAVLASLNNTGQALGRIGPSGNFNIFDNGTKLFMTFLMFLGRLEIFPMLILFMPSTWRKH